jgi:hypothetical protein
MIVCLVSVWLRLRLVILMNAVHLYVFPCESLILVQGRLPKRRLDTTADKLSKLIIKRSFRSDAYRNKLHLTTTSWFPACKPRLAHTWEDGMSIQHADRSGDIWLLASTWTLAFQHLDIQCRDQYVPTGRYFSIAYQVSQRWTSLNVTPQKGSAAQKRSWARA